MGTLQVSGELAWPIIAAGAWCGVVGVFHVFELSPTFLISTSWRGLKKAAQIAFTAVTP